MKIYWKQKNGVDINVDDMSEQHAKNALKFMLRNIETARIEAKKEFTKLTGFKLNGDMANEFNDQQMSDFEEDTDYPY